MKRRYHISPEGRPRPTEKEIERLKDPKRLLYNYEKAVRRPKVPIYKDPKAFITLLLIVLLAWFIAETTGPKGEEPVPPDTIEEELPR
jgi:hypothetical protein